jgi:hypothetical protein
MIPMLPMCQSHAMPMSCNHGMMGMSPVMMPMMPMPNAPYMCAPNNMDLFSTTSIMSEYDSHMYGRFRHVEREHPTYRHAPFDWYRPPKQHCHIIHEDAAVVTLDGPVPLGDFYRHYIYGDDMDDYDDYDDDDLSSFDSDEYDDTIEPYEPRPAGYRRYPGEDQDLEDDIGARLPSNRTAMGRGNYAALNANRRTGVPTRPSAYRGNRTLAGDDEFDDAASVNSTYGN